MTWVTHNSRISERMVQFRPPEFIKGLKATIMNRSQQKYVVKLLIEKIKQLDVKVVTLNVLPDHVHLIIALYDSTELADIVGQLKGYSSFHFRKKYDIVGGLWAQKFHRRWINTDRYLRNAIHYVQNNHIKHEPSWGESFLYGFDLEFQELRDEVCFDPWE